MTRVVLASASPRRRELLAALGWDVFVHPADVDEAPLPDETPEAMVLRLARLKAQTIAASHAHAVVVAADTTVVIDGAALSKPLDAAVARAMLWRLAGRTHSVLTGFCVRRGAAERAAVVQTAVRFRALSAMEIDAYVSTGDSLDKAGGYGIQGPGGALIDRVEGSYPNVVGLPVAEVLAAIEQLLQAEQSHEDKTTSIIE